MAKLSICVPSRNRQVWFQQTIRALLENPRPDVEFVFADNSDDASVMADFMREFSGDRRVVFLAPASAPLSMLDNWERCVAASTGDWVTVIGDDDYVDPDLATLLARIDMQGDGCEALDWLKLDYFWPGQKVRRANIKIGFDTEVVEIPKARLHQRLFLWDASTCVPSAGYSVYHSAIARPLMERIRKRFGGRYFEHPTVDYDSAYKVVLEGTHFAYTSRPFSVHGRSPTSSSGLMMTGAQASTEKNVEFMKELGRDLKEDNDPNVPIDHRLGVTGSIIQTMLWVLRTYGLKCDGWQINFAKACAENCHIFSDRKEFEQISARYRAALSLWENGRYLPYFNPVQQEHLVGAAFTGRKDQIVYIGDEERTFSTPSALYHIVKGMLEEPAEMRLWEVTRPAWATPTTGNAPPLAAAG